MRKEDKVYEEYRGAKGEQKVELEERLYSLLSQHAKEVSAGTLREIAPDVVAEIVSRVFTNFDKFRGKSLFSTWVHRIALNECYRELKRREDNQEVAIEDLSESEYAGLTTTSPGKVEEVLEVAIKGLNREEKKLANLIKEGLSFIEIDEEMGYSPKTAQKKWERMIRGKMRRKFEELGIGRVG
jgi:RNA polymerase sigma-70 factor (ECF subfamily)